MKSGFVSFVGRPNVGKSTLINSIIGTKIAITSNKPQTTRNIIRGIYNEEDVQIIFVDTPGIHKPNHKLGKILNKQAYYSMNDVDIILMLVDVTEEIGTGDKYVIDKIKEYDKPVILVLNKVDLIPKEKLFNKIEEYQTLYDFKEYVPISALKDKNQKMLIDVIKKYLKDNIKYYEEGQTISKPIEFVLAEMVREKVFILTDEEVPHSITSIVESVEIGKTSCTINVNIIVDRDALKKIIIGKGGSMIKEIGTRARIDMEKVLNKKVYLNLFVKTVKKWRDQDKYLEEYGFTDFLK